MVRRHVAPRALLSAIIVGFSPHKTLVNHYVCLFFLFPLNIAAIRDVHSMRVVTVALSEKLP